MKLGVEEISDGLDISLCELECLCSNEILGHVDGRGGASERSNAF